MQLAFDCSGNLIGHATGTGEFYVIDRATGGLTPLGSADGRLFNDLAPGGECCEPPGTETAWGGGTSFPGGSWAMYFEFTP